MVTFRINPGLIFSLSSSSFMSYPYYAIILAGGSGERFWPLSRKKKPKQLLRLFSDKTLLEETLDRLEGVVSPERIIVLTSEDQVEGVRAILGDQLPAENIVAEPAKRDTAPAIALAVSLVASRDREAAMLILPADHLIRNREAFRKDATRALEAARTVNALVTIGIAPTWACPSFGYIEQGKPLDHMCEGGFHKVVRFREKPSIELAESFLRSGHFRWNAGMFAWSVSAITAAMAAHSPPLAHFIETSTDKGGLRPSWKEAFPQLPKLSIDYAVMEKAEHVVVFDASFDWDDVGNWQALAAYLDNVEIENAANSPVTAHDSTHNILFSTEKTHIALLGVSDLIIVHTKDALLVARRTEAERIKELVAKLPPPLQ